MVTEKDVTAGSSEAGVASSTNEAAGITKAGSQSAEVPEYNRYRELDRKLSDLQSHVATLVDILSTNQTAKAEESDSSIDSIAEEDPVKAMKAIAAKTKQEILGEQTKQREFERKQREYDSRAIARYPDLNNPNTELWKMTDQVLKERKADGLDPKNDPRAVLDAADAAFARLVQEGRLSLSSTPSERKRIDSVNSGRTESSRGSSSSSEETLDNAKLSADQEFYANKLGISKEAYLKRAKEGVFWKSRRNQLKWGED